MYKIRFYTTARGDSPIDEFLDGIPPKARAKVDGFVDTLAQMGPALHRPYTDHVRGKIRELRVGFGGNQYRLLYAFFLKDTILILHAFAKKTQKLPANEIVKVEQRLTELSIRHEKGEVET